MTGSFAFRIILTCALATAPAMAAECPPTPIVALSIVVNDLGSPIIPILIDDRPRNALIDTGGFWSMVSPSISRVYGTRKSGIDGRLGLEGIKIDKAVKVPSIQIGPVRVTDVDFYEAPEGYSDDAVTLGANWLSRFDVEIDPVADKVVFFPKSRCGADAIYWRHSDFAELPVRVDRAENLVTIPVILDGREIRALIDTGAPETFLSQRVAEQLFGLKPDSPGMLAEEPDADQTGLPRQMYRRQFGQLSLGGVAIAHPWLVISPMTDKGPDMILGMRQLSGLHLYFAYGEQKLYATTATGDVAARRTGAPGGGPADAPLRDPVALSRARDDLMVAAAAQRRGDYDGAAAAIERAILVAPNYAPAYVERAELLAARGRHDRAIATLDQALTLDPKNVSGLLERSQIYIVTGNPERALADANQAITLQPGGDEAHAVRAEAYAAQGAWDRAMRDATFAIRLDPKSVSGWLTRSHIYELMGDYGRAITDADQAVRLEPRSAAALNSRCWTGAILDRLEAALNDCDAAVAIRPHNAEIQDSRAFVHLKAGRLAAALADYDAALAINPDFASSLYGRGLAKRRMGDVAGAAHDIAAAAASDPDIARHFGK